MLPLLLVQELSAQIEDSVHFEETLIVNQENWEEDESNDWVISVNAYDLSQLLTLPGVEVKDIQLIHAYIKENGKIIHLNELHQIQNLSKSCIAVITPHVSVKNFEAIGEKKSFIHFRIKKSNTSSAVLRSQSYIQALPNLSLGGLWSLENGRIASQYSAYVDYKKNNLHMIAGDFSPLIGEGKIGSIPSMGNMGWGFTQVIRPHFRIKPYTSTIPLQQWRGIGCTQQIKNWHWLMALPLGEGNQQKIIAFQYKDKFRSIGIGIIQEETWKHWFQAIFPWSLHVISLESVFEKQKWQPSIAVNLALSKSVKSKWQSQWEIRPWNQCMRSHWIVVLEWNFNKGQYFTLGKEIDQAEKDREVGALELRHDTFLQYQFEPQRYGKFYIRYVLHHKEQMGKKDNLFEPNQQIRGDGQWKADEHWSLHTRAEIHWTQGQKSSLAFQDVQWHPMGSAWKLTLRYAIMNSPSWDGRIYAMEKETSGSFYVPAYYGSGNRIYLVSEFKKSHFQLQIKIGKWERRQEKNIPMDGQILLKIIF